MAGHINEGTIGTAIVRHQGRQGALAATAQQRSGKAGGIEIGVRLHLLGPGILLQ